MFSPSGDQIIDFVLHGPAGRNAHPMDPDKRRPSADEVEKFVYPGGKPVDWAHMTDVASAARPAYTEFPWEMYPELGGTKVRPIASGDTDRHEQPCDCMFCDMKREAAHERGDLDDYDGPGTEGMSELPGE